MTHILKNCPGCGINLTGLENDKRAVRWRCRVRLYDMVTDDKSPQADSDPELDPDQPGTEIVWGLKGVADLVIQMAGLYHGTGMLSGLDAATLDAKIPGLRPTLSRRGGNAVWRLPYDTVRTWSADPGHEPVWLARVDLERVDGDEEAPSHERPHYRRAS
jgi:hypothetical protein